MRARKVKIEHKGKFREFSKFAITEDGKRVVRIEPGIRNRSYVGRVLKQKVDTRGYFIVKIWSNKDKKTHNIPVHRIMARTFLGPCPEGKEVNHKDGIKLSNHYKNLEYVTRSENTKHAYDLGLNTSPMKGKIGELCPFSKVVENDVREIKRLYTTGKYFQEEIAEIFGVSGSLINKIIRGINWAHVDPKKKYIYNKPVMKGEKHPYAKLCNNDVRKIRKLWKTGKYTQTKLAEMFNLRSSGTIGSITREKTWTHLL